MAMLMQKYKLSNGLVSDQAYLTVDSISGNKQSMSAVVKVYISEEASVAKLQPIDEFTVVFVPDVSESSLNYHKQTYNHLKSLPKYENAIDAPYK